MDGSPEDTFFPGHHVAPVSMSCSEVLSERVKSTYDLSAFDEHEGSEEATAWKKDDNSEETAPSVTELELPPEPWALCGQIPCDWIYFGDQIIEECDEIMDQNQPNNQIRYHAYRLT